MFFMDDGRLSRVNLPGTFLYQYVKELWRYGRPPAQALRRPCTKIIFLLLFHNQRYNLYLTPYAKVMLNYAKETLKDLCPPLWPSLPRTSASASRNSICSIKNSVSLVVLRSSSNSRPSVFHV